MRVTLKDIAQRTGTSHSTVSRALHDSPRLSVATRQRIQAVAKKMGYRPDPALAGLAVYRSQVKPPRRYEKIAILSHEKESRQMPPKVREHIEGIRSRSQELGFEPELFLLDDDRKSQHRLSRVLYYQGVRGIILPPLLRLPTGFNWKMFSIVGIGENAMPLGINYVRGDHDEAICQVYQQLRSRGYRNIGYLNIEESEKRNRHLFYSAYLKSRVLDGLPPAPPLFHKPEDMSGLLHWLRRNRFDAVICSDLKIIPALAGSEFKVPEVLGLAGASFPVSQALSSSFACYVMDGVRFGRLAVDFLQALIQKNQCGIPKPEDQSAVFVRGYWRDGKTVREPQPGNPLAEKGRAISYPPIQSEQTKVTLKRSARFA